MYLLTWLYTSRLRRPPCRLFSGIYYALKLCFASCQCCFRFEGSVNCRESWFVEDSIGFVLILHHMWKPQFEFRNSETFNASISFDQYLSLISNTNSTAIHFQCWCVRVVFRGRDAIIGRVAFVGQPHTNNNWSDAAHWPLTAGLAFSKGQISKIVMNLATNSIH